MYRYVYSSSRHLLEVGGWVQALAALPPGERASGSHWIGGWEGSRAGLDDVEKSRHRLVVTSEMIWIRKR
jgi:hypothetical protein